MGEGMACGGLPFPGTGCPIPDVDYLCLLCIDFYVWDAVSTFNHLPRMFLSTDFAFWITDWTCCHGPYLHAILRIISRGVSGLATDSPCGVWGRGWTTCLLHDWLRDWDWDWDKFIQHNMTLYRCMISDIHDSSYVLFRTNLISNTSLHVGRPLLRPCLVAYAEATLARQKR